MNYRVEKSLHTALACVTAFIIGEYFGLENVYWALITIFIVILDYPQQAFKKALLRIMGTIFGAFVGLVTTSYTINNPWLYILLLFSIAAFATYKSYRSPYAYAWMLGGATAFMVQISASIDSNLSFHIAVWRSSEIILGCIIAMLIQITTRQRNLYVAFHQHLVTVCQLVADEITALAHTLDNQNENIIINKNNFQQAFTVCQNELALINDRRVQPHWLLQAKTCLSNLKLIHLYLVNFEYSSENKQETLFVLKKEIQQLLVEIALHVKNYSLSLSVIKKQHKMLKAKNKLILDYYQTFRASGKTKQYPLISVLEEYKWINLCSYFVNTLDLDTTELNKHTISFFDNKNLLLKHCIKVGLTCVATFYAWLYSGWYAGMIGVVSSYLVIMQDNVASSIDKAKQRFLGCLIGSIVGIISISYFTHAFLPMILTLAIVAFAFGYFIHGKPSYSYMALQGAVAFVIAVISTNNVITTSIDPSLERLAGIYLGVIVSLIISFLVWPSHPKKWLQEGLDKNKFLFIDFLHRLKEHQHENQMSILNQIEAQQNFNSMLINFFHQPAFQQQIMQHQHLLRLCKLITKNDAPFEFYEKLNFPLQQFIDNLILLLEQSSKPLTNINIADHLLNYRKNYQTLNLNFIDFANYLQQLDYLSHLEKELNQSLPDKFTTA